MKTTPSVTALTFHLLEALHTLSNNQNFKPELETAMMDMMNSWSVLPMGFGMLAGVLVILAAGIVIGYIIAGAH